MNHAIFTPDELLAKSQHPELGNLAALKLSPEDCLIVAAGFEARSIASLHNALHNSSTFNVVSVVYSPHVPQNRLAALKDCCADHGITSSEIVYDRQQPSGSGQSIINLAAAHSGKLFIDVSGMSRLLIVQLIVSLASRPNKFQDCFIIYSEAEHYPPSEDQAIAEIQKYENDPSTFVWFLSSNIFEITILPELASVAVGGAQTRLISFPSFDAHHLTALRLEIQPSRFSFIEGISPYATNLWRTNIIARVNRLDEIRDAERCNVSTLDYRETLTCLIDLYKKHAIRDRMIVSPTGSKMQSVAVGIFRAFVHDVQIVYPTPQRFHSPDDYTLGVGPMHILDLSLFDLP